MHRRRWSSASIPRPMRLFGCTSIHRALTPHRFADHEKFFVEDVRQWTTSRFGVELRVERTAMCGVSAGAELALALGLRHPDLYGAILCASPGAGYRPPSTMPSRCRAHTSSPARTNRSFSTTRSVGPKRCANGTDVVMKERAGSHGDPFWRQEFPPMIKSAFGQ